MHALLSLGANVGRPVEQLARAVRQLAGIGAVEATSSVYRTAPVGFVDQPDFLNLVCLLRTQLSPRALLAATQEMEGGLGRVRGRKGGPRTIDIDLLSCDVVLMDVPDLQLPHPRLHQRGFVLWPLLEIAPDWRHPALQLTPAEMIHRADSLERVERLGSLKSLIFPSTRNP